VEITLPRRRSKGIKAAKAEIVAAGIVAGKTNGQIAKEAGCSTRHVQRLAGEAETKLIITHLMAPYRRELAKLVPKTIAAVSRALDAKKSSKQDHYAQMQGVAKAQELLGMAQGKLPEEQSSGPQMITWDELLVLYRSRRQVSAEQNTNS
jgi:hypothetical protein